MRSTLAAVAVAVALAALSVQAQEELDLSELQSFIDTKPGDPAALKQLVDRTLPLDQARDGFAALIDGDIFGKVVFTL